MFSMFQQRKEPCAACEVMQKLLLESEKRNKELLVMLKDTQDQVLDHNKELTDSITGKSTTYQKKVDPPGPRSMTWTQRRNNIEAADRNKAARIRKETEDAERAAGLTGTDGES